MHLPDWLRRPYGIVTGCVLLSGVTVGLVEDLRYAVYDWGKSVIWTEADPQTACVTEYLSTRTPAAPGSYLIILTELVNDSDHSQTLRIDQTLRQLYGQDIGSPIQLEAIPCAIFATAGNADNRAGAAQSLARDIASRTKADVVIWGEVITRDARIALSMTHADATASGAFAVENSSLTTDFGAAIGSLIAAKMLTGANLTREDSGSLLTGRMQRVLALTAPLVADPPAQMTDADRADLFRVHGQALYLIGLQTGDLGLLNDAVTACRTALAGYADPATRQDWAVTQNLLGIALAVLGERETGTDRLQQAAEALTAALTVFSPQTDPLAWATAQNNLGNVLANLGGRTEGDAALPPLTGAIAAFDLAMTVHSQQAAPLDWARIQNNRGNTLMDLARHQDGDLRLQQAVAAYRAALSERRRDRVPLDWAATQNNLGTALQALDDGGPGTDWLDQAAAAFNAALQERRQADLPVDWAKTTYNLARLDRDYYLKTGDAARLAAARTQAEAARATFVTAGASQYVAAVDVFLADLAQR